MHPGTHFKGKWVERGVRIQVIGGQGKRNNQFCEWG